MAIPTRSLLIESLFGYGAIATVLRTPGNPASLLPDERRDAATFAEKRLVEFAAGRACARSALRALGLPEKALPIREDRQPEWPPGYTGSITHTSGHCGAVVARTTRFSSLGLDVERIGRVVPDLWDRLFTSSERASLRGMNVDDAACFATVLFSAKESVYKCQFARTGEWLDFCDVDITVAEPTTSPQTIFTADLTRPDPSTGPIHLIGRYVVLDDVVWTGVGIIGA